MLHLHNGIHHSQLGFIRFVFKQTAVLTTLQHIYTAQDLY